MIFIFVDHATLADNIWRQRPISKYQKDLVISPMRSPWIRAISMIAHYHHRMNTFLSSENQSVVLVFPSHVSQMNIPPKVKTTPKNHVTEQPKIFILDGTAAPVNMTGSGDTTVELLSVLEVKSVAGVVTLPPLLGVGTGPTGK